jgi:uncharacterized membrane protein
VADAPTDLPQEVPAYTLRDPHRTNMEAWPQLRLVFGRVFVVVFVIFALMVHGQMSSAPHFGMPWFTS